jgi:hypothetical protein
MRLPQVHRLWCSRCTWSEDIRTPSEIEGVSDNAVRARAWTRHYRKCPGVPRIYDPLHDSGKRAW